MADLMAGQGDSLGAEIVKRIEKLRQDRSTWEAHWREVADRVIPRMNHFQGDHVTPGEKRTELIFDSTAALALDRFAAALESMLTPRVQKWHKLKSTDPELNKLHDVRIWFDRVTDVLFQKRYEAQANYASQAHEVYVGLGAFGTSSLAIDPRPGGGLRYRAMHLSEFYIVLNWQGMVDTLIRRFRWSARQMHQRWDPSVLPDKVREALTTDPDKQQFDIIHYVAPNDEFDPIRLDSAGMRFTSVYVLEQDKRTLSRGGFRTWPYPTSRYVTGTRETYGRSPAMLVLPDIKMLNQMSKTTIKNAELHVSPPWAVHDDGVLGALKVTPNAVNYGMVTREGRPLAQRLDVGGDIGLGLEMENQRRGAINDAFLVTLFQILVETPMMTATEALIRAQEKGALLTPAIGRQQSELLGPQIERELDILEQQGFIPPPPPVLLEAFGSDVTFDIEYDSPLTRAQRAEEGVGFLRTVEAITPLANIEPRIMRRFDGDEILMGLSEINAMPAKWLRTDEELAAMDRADQEAARQQQLLDAAPAVADSAQKLAKAQQLLTQSNAG